MSIFTYYKNIKKSSCNFKGLTLMEVLITLVIISLVFLVILEMFRVGFLITNTTQKDSTALYLAQNKLEEAKHELNSGINPEIVKTQLPNPFLEFSYEVKVNSVNGINDIKVVIYYDDREIALETKSGARQ